MVNKSTERIISKIIIVVFSIFIIDYYFGSFGIIQFIPQAASSIPLLSSSNTPKYHSILRYDSHFYPMVDIGSVGSVVRGDSEALPFYDIVIVVPSPWSWIDRRKDLYNTWLKGDQRTSKTSRLIFPVSRIAEPEKLSEFDQSLYYSDPFAYPYKPTPNTGSTSKQQSQTSTFNSDTTYPIPKRRIDPVRLYPSSSATIVTVPCEELDGDFAIESNSSTLCKLLEGMCYAAEHYRFDYLARVGDDTYFRWDYFLESIISTIPSEKLWMGMRLTDGKYNRDSAYFTNLWHFEKLPPYMSGMGYIFSKDLVYYLCGIWRTGMVKSSYPEDGIVGLYLFPLHVNMIDSSNFHNRINPNHRPWRQQACTPESIMIHYMDHEDWEKIDEHGVAQC